jgi:hypothetical protein
LLSVHRPIAQNLAEIRFSRSGSLTAVTEIVDFTLDSVAVIAQHSSDASAAVIVVETGNDAVEVDFTDGTFIPLQVRSEFSAGRDFTLF